MNFEEKKILINTHGQLQFCPLVWMLSSASSLQEIENLQKRALSFLNVLCVELYKTINKLNPNFMRDFFKLRFTNRTVREKYKINMIIPSVARFLIGKKSLRTFGPKLWNSLPYHIKYSENLESFKRTIKHWNGERCLLRFAIAVNKLIIRFNVDILFVLEWF